MITDKSIEITIVAGTRIEVKETGSTGPVEVYNKDQITNILGINNDITGDTGELQDMYPFPEQNIVTVQLTNDTRKLSFDIAQVTNQATWAPPSEAKLVIAVDDLKLVF